MSELADDMIAAANKAIEVNVRPEEWRTVISRRAVASALQELVQEADAREALGVSVTTLNSLIREIEVGQ